MKAPRKPLTPRGRRTEATLANNRARSSEIASLTRRVIKLTAAVSFLMDQHLSGGSRRRRRR